MFREPLDDLREDVLEDLETYVWGHLFSLVDERKNPSIKNAALAHLLLAYNPEFVEKLVISAGISARELQKLLDSVVVKFAQCLMISLQHAFINEPLRLDSLIELSAGLDEILKFVSEGELDFRLSLKAENAEQELPQFLATDLLYLETILLDAIAEIVAKSAILSDERILELAQGCVPEEADKFKSAMARINAYATPFLESSVTGEELAEILLVYLAEKVLITEP